MYKIKGRGIKLTGDPSSNRYEVEIGGAVWSMTKTPSIRFAGGEVLPFPKPLSEVERETGTTKGFEAVYGFPREGGRTITLRARAEVETITDDIFFTLITEGDLRGEIEYVAWPAPFDYGKAYGDTDKPGKANLPYSYTVLPRMQGTLVPAGTHIRIASGEIMERDAYIPIFGQVRGDSGYLAIYDTPFDARYSLDYEEGREGVAPGFVPSLGRMAYPRRMLYRFMRNCDYNRFAASYRQYVDSRGKSVTLREKFARNPKAARLPGCPIIHEGIAVHISPDSNYYKPDKPENNDHHVTFAQRAEELRALYAKGLRKAYIHLDGWGNHGYDNLHPDPFPPHEAAGGAESMKELSETARECGYIFGIHDQYRDYYYDAPSFSFDNAVMQADGGHPFCSIWYGGKHSYLCSSLARDYVRRNYATFEELGIKIEGSYLDVFSVVSMDECFNPAHPATREQCAAYRRECLDILSDRGIIPSSEEVLDCILPSQVLCHHAPYFTSNLGSTEAQSVGIHIPLLNLVYHDCVVIPWIGRKGSRGGWGIPGTDSGYAHGWLNGNPLYLSIKADEKVIAEIMPACENAERLALQKMVKHEFLTPDRRIQRTTFEDGSTVTVNFDTDEVTLG